MAAWTPVAVAVALAEMVTLEVRGTVAMVAPAGMPAPVIVAPMSVVANVPLAPVTVAEPLVVLTEAVRAVVVLRSSSGVDVAMMPES